MRRGSGRARRRHFILEDHKGIQQTALMWCTSAAAVVCVEVTIGLNEKQDRFASKGDFYLPEMAEVDIYILSQFSSTPSFY